MWFESIRYTITILSTCIHLVVVSQSLSVSLTIYCCCFGCFCFDFVVLVVESVRMLRLAFVQSIWNSQCWFLDKTSTSLTLEQLSFVWRSKRHVHHFDCIAIYLFWFVYRFLSVCVCVFMCVHDFYFVFEFGLFVFFSLSIFIISTHWAG